jgi:pimeloyl-ACP methyl ester carboxylesterase
LEKRCGCKIPTGTEPSVLPVRLTLDPVTLLWRPLSYYLLVYSVNHLIKYVYVTHWRVSFATYDRLEYFTRIPRHWNPATGPRPIVFVHGLGLGLLQYHTTLVHLFKQFPDRPLLVLLQPQISQRIFHPHYLNPLPRQQAAELLSQLIIKLGWAKDVNGSDSESTSSGEEKAVTRRHAVTMMSHSNGSYTHAWMLKDHPTLIRRSCFIDPVTFCSWEGDVCYNFIYRPCRTGMEILMKYFVGAEIGVANLLQRHFDWASNSLFFEEIPNARDPSRTLFVLGGKDAILNAARVKRYLTSHGVKKGILYDHNGAHGQALLPGSHMHTEIFKWLKDD